MAKMEHNRWNAERWLAGWRKGPKDPGSKLNPNLIEWEKLDPKVQDWDRAFVRDIPKMVSVWRQNRA